MQLLSARVPLNYASLFSGIGGFDIGFDRAGMRCVAQAEWDQAASEVLKHHWPNVTHLKDVRDVTRDSFRSIDVLCGGFPCQDVSVAGKRAGLDGERSGLWFEFYRIIKEHTPRWVVIENVPGLLTSNRGRDFAVIIDGLVKCGYRVAWRVLDAQYFGLAQRRKRVFIVASFGDGRCTEVLFEREGSDRNTSASREAGESITGTLAAGAHPSGFNGRDAERGMLVPFSNRGKTTGDIAETIRAGSHGALPMLAEAIDARNSCSNGGVSGTLQSKKSGGYSLNYINPVAFMAGQGANARSIAACDDFSPTLKGVASGTNQVPTIAYHASTGEDVSPSLTSEGADGSEDGRGRHAFAVNSYGVRRLTPTECERLQGFPDGHTAVNGQSDSRRYKQLGNAVAVPVAEWIARRIVAADTAA